jgi:threonine/homoserine/homoserine lactone efflux protein
MGYLAALSLVDGRLDGVMAAAGAAMAFVIARAVALIAATELEPHINVGSQILRVVGSLYFLWLAVDTWRAADRALQPADSPPLSEARAFTRNLFANLPSPKTWIFYRAVVRQPRAQTRDHRHARPRAYRHRHSRTSRHRDRRPRQPRLL